MRKIFKTILTSILCFGLLFSAFACENGSGFNGNSTTGNSQESPSTESDGDSTGGELNEEYVSIGAFYTLEEAYENDWLSQSDLLNIAFYYQGSENEDFQPTPKDPEALSKEQILEIKKTYLCDVLKISDGDVEKINLYKYYGTYNGMIAVGVTDTYYLYDIIVNPEYEIGGVVFYNFCSSDIRLWWAKDVLAGEDNVEYKKGNFYSFEEAYNQGRITREDIMHVCYYAFGKVYEGEKGIAEKDLREIEFQPTVELGSLSENVLADIKQNYYEENKSEFYDRNGNKLGGVENLQIDFFGKYGAAYVVSVNCDLWEYNCSVWVESIDGIAWIEGGAAFLVFQHAE